MKISKLVILLLLSVSFANAQTNIKSTNPLCLPVLTNDFNPADFMPSNIISNPQDITAALQLELSADTLKSYLEILSSFENRNTGSDTLSLTTGIGAARKWVHAKFEEFSANNENRLLPSYLSFEKMICSMDKHKNIFAVLPGSTTENEGIILIEGHIDSRCESGCDIDCEAHGMEDNGSGTALVIELARVMSAFSFKHTIVFMATIGEEQGLHGADAFADWAVANDIPIKAVLNNDVIGGIICGETSSPPSCPGFNEIDSTQVRLFSRGSWNSPHKSLVRFVKLEYQEELLPLVDVPMVITIMTSEDRVGRGGDHIPFREKGFTAIRFTSANEHGDAGIDADYHDRQHTKDDILGVDTDGDLVIDSFFVDFNYLKRNAAINGMAATMLAQGPVRPSFSAERLEQSIHIIIDDPNNYDHYRVGLRSTTNDFDTIYTIVGSKEATLMTPSNDLHYLTVASVDVLGVESCFTPEQWLAAVGTGEIEHDSGTKSIYLLNNRPNPFDESTMISFMVNEVIPHEQASIHIYNGSGALLKDIPCTMKEGINEVLYEHGYGTSGRLYSSLLIDGNIVDSKAMIFAN